MQIDTHQNLGLFSFFMQNDGLKKTEYLDRESFGDCEKWKLFEILE